MVLGGEKMKTNKTINIIVTGVGGQGLITLGDVLGTAAVLRGVKVFVSEVHGLAQRGGSVIVHVRIGEPNSPLVPEKGANVILALEVLEAIRAIATYANPKTLVIVNRRLIRPVVPGVKLKNIDEYISYIKKLGLKVIELNALDLAIKAGNPLGENMVMIGALLASKALNGLLDLNDVEKAIQTVMSKKWFDVNIKALRMGYEEVAKVSQ